MFLSITAETPKFIKWHWKNVNIEPYVKFQNIDFSLHLPCDFQFFLDH